MGTKIREKFTNTLAARLLLVLTAFLLMILSSCLVMNATLNEKILQDAEMTMDDTQFIFSRILLEPEALLNLIAGDIEEIYDRGEGYQAIFDYMASCSTSEFKSTVSMLNYNSVFGYFEQIETFYDGSGWKPGPDYQPKERPWYLAAEVFGGKVGMTSLYLDADTGHPVVSYARKVYDSEGRLIGTIAIEIFIEYLRDMVVNKRITPNSYGFMIDDNSIIVMHPSTEVEGYPYGESNPDIMERYGRDIRLGRDISLQRVPNFEGMSSIIFGRQLDNGWYFILLIPEQEYYSELYRMIIISSVLGIVFGGLLIFMLVRIEMAKRRADEDYKQKVIRLAEAEGATQAKSSFLAQMSHEIRTPMNAILGITEIQLQDEALPAGVREALGKIYNSGDLLLGIINDILDLSKIEAGKLELSDEEYDFSSMFVDTVQLNRMRIGSKQIEFLMEVCEDIPATLLGDELRVKQILNNVLSNAFKYTEKGTVTLGVSCQSNDSKVILVFTVKDTGQGMTAEQVEKLGEQYSRFNAQANRTTEGTGLGMSITKNLVHLMDGSISVESEPGKGSTFTVSIPQGRVGTDVLGAEGAKNLSLSRTSSAARMKRAQITREPMPYGSVLIVDDVETNIYVASGLLAPYGLKLDSAESGYEAIEKVKSGNTYDVIFMDHMMPNMDGVETTKRIREMGYSEPIIALTANAVAGRAEMFLSSGFNDYISKPIDMRQMNAALNKWIRDKQPPEVLEAARKKGKSENSDLAETPNSDGSQSETLLPTSHCIDPKMAEIFLRDAGKSTAVLDEIAAKDGAYSDDDLRLFTINVHGLKTTLAIIGKAELSETARQLEELGREGNRDAVASGLPPFLDALKVIMEDISASSEGPGRHADDTEDGDIPYLHGKLDVIKAACREFDSKTAVSVINELKEKTWSKRTGKLLATISELLLHSDFDEVVSEIDAFM